MEQHALEYPHKDSYYSWLEYGFFVSSHLSYITKEKYCHTTTTSAAALYVTLRGTPWIHYQGGLEISGKKKVHQFAKLRKQYFFLQN